MNNRKTINLRNLVGLLERKRIVGVCAMILALLSALAYVGANLERFGFADPVILYEPDEKAQIVTENASVIDENAHPANSVSLTLVFDGSDLGMRRLQANRTFDYVNDALLEFADQGHSVSAAACRRFGRKTDLSVVWKDYVELNSETWPGLNKFKSIQFYNGNGKLGYDYNYFELLKKGIELIQNNSVNTDRRVLVMFIGSHDNGSAPSKANIDRVVKTMEENNIDLYVMTIDPSAGGLVRDPARGNPYPGDSLKRLLKYTPKEHLYNRVAREEIRLTLRQIMENTCAAEMSEASVGSHTITIPKPTAGRANCSVGLNLYSVGEFTYEVVWNRDAGDYVDRIVAASGTADEPVTRVDIDISGNIMESQSSQIELNILSTETGKRVFYTYDYTQCDVFEIPMKARSVGYYDHLYHTTGVDLRLLMNGLMCVLAALLLIDLLVRTSRACWARKRVRSIDGVREKNVSVPRVIQIYLDMNDGEKYIGYHTVNDIDTAGASHGWHSLRKMVENKVGKVSSIADIYFSVNRGNLVCKKGDITEIVSDRLPVFDDSDRLIGDVMLVKDSTSNR